VFFIVLFFVKKPCSQHRIFSRVSFPRGKKGTRYRNNLFVIAMTSLNQRFLKRKMLLYGSLKNVDCGRKKHAL